jgi:flagellar biosynthesis GTPase FlhF
VRKTTSVISLTGLIFLLLDESQQHWTKGEIDDALQILDQAYFLLMDANGNSEIARQKDDNLYLIAKNGISLEKLLTLNGI